MAPVHTLSNLKSAVILGTKKWRARRKRGLSGVVPVDQPLVLMSQIERSGGHLFTRLFDGHPECHSHPVELTIGRPKIVWPVFDLDQPPEALWESLYVPRLRYDSQVGQITRGGSNRNFGESPVEILISYDRQRQLFIDLVESSPARTRRNVLNCYFTSFFNEWLNCDPRGEKKYIMAFIPRLNMSPYTIGFFFDDYPDGFYLSNIRDPMSWWRSAQRLNPHQYPNVTTAIHQWMESTEGTIQIKQRFGERVVVLRFEDWLTDSEKALRRLCDFLGIAFYPSLLQPTLGGNAVLPNSSFDTANYGISKDPVARGNEISPEDRRFIEEHAVPLYEKAMSLVW